MARERYLIGVTESELTPPPPPPPPKTPKEKLEHFWLYHKWKAIAAAVALTLVAVITFQLLNRPRYDYTLVVVSDTPLTTRLVGQLQHSMEVYTEKGKTVQVVTFVPNAQGDIAALSAIMKAEEDVFFAFSPGLYKDWMGADSDFTLLDIDAPGVSADKRYWNWKNSSLYVSSGADTAIPPVLYFGVREVANMDKAQTENFRRCKELLEHIIQVETAALSDAAEPTDPVD